MTAVRLGEPPVFRVYVKSSDVTWILFDRMKKHNGFV